MLPRLGSEEHQNPLCNTVVNKIPHCLTVSRESFSSDTIDYSLEYTHDMEGMTSSVVVRSAKKRTL